MSKRKNILGSVLKNIQLRRRFFAFGVVLAALAGLGFAWNPLYIVAQALFFIFLALAVVEGLILFIPNRKLHARRKTVKMLSLGDKNLVQLTLQNHLGYRVFIEIFEDLPVQLQQRGFHIERSISSGERAEVHYQITPLTRGMYSFGRTNVIATTRLGLVARRYRLKTNMDVPAFPSIVQMKKYELLAFAKVSTTEGIKKVRRLGHSYEFEHIKSYVQGDDIRSINWKATSRRNALMVNQYEDERSQQMYTIIDKSRVMHMPFHGLTLLDHAINTSLVISNIALKKHDRAGLITFSHAIGSAIKAEKGPHQLKKILQALYNERSAPNEANFDLLYRASKNIISGRSLIFLYTNFESNFALERALPVLRKINRNHLLVVIIFENSELVDYSRENVTNLYDIYTQGIAERLVIEKKQIVARMRKEGIQSILSKPEDLSINTVNKYLELKSKGMI